MDALCILHQLIASVLDFLVFQSQGLNLQHDNKWNDAIPKIGRSLNLKQSTIESYLSNIKNKLGVSLKSELIQKIIDTQILQNIAL